MGIALLQSDVDVTLVKRLQDKIRARYVEISQDKSTRFGARKLLNSMVENEIVCMVTPQDAQERPDMKRGKKTHRIMFVGLQGAGKTTTCAKYAYYYKRKGWKVGIIAADTYRAGAYDQTRQNALKAGVYYYGKPDEKDPAVVVELGLEAFASSKVMLDMIILDTAGRHKQEAALFEEMQAINRVFQPDDTVFVMDASVGRSIGEQAKAFADHVTVGSIVLTKMDGGSKGGGALTAIAKTKSPISFIGIGEHIGDLQRFNATSFVRRLLGDARVDLHIVMDAVDDKQLNDFKDTVYANGRSNHVMFATMREQMQQMHNMGGMSMLSQMLPKDMAAAAKAASGPKGDGGDAAVKRALVMFDSMTPEELSGTNKLFNKQPSRIMRLAKGSGNSEQTVRDFLSSFKQFERAQQQLKRMSGMRGSMSVQRMMNVNMGRR